MNKFDPNPQFYNQMGHWQPWAEHFKDAEGDIGMLAKMLGLAWEEIERLRKIGCETSKRHAMLLFAFVETAERLGIFANWAIASPARSADSKASAWKSVGTLNKWRAENKFNIKEWDVT